MWLDAGRGSGEIANLSRAVIHIDKLPGQELFVLAQAAANNGRPIPAITYRIVERKGQGIVEVVGECNLTADEIVAGEEGDLDKSIKEKAKDLLRGLLTKDGLDSKIIKSKAEAAMVGIRTLQQAAHELGVQIKREGRREDTVVKWYAPKAGLS